jgi:RHS repeat-associated protein
VRHVGLDDIEAKSVYEGKVLFQQSQYPAWKAWDITSLTQKWANGSATNYGVVVWATNENTDGYDLRFHSSDAPPPNNANPPVLEVTYSSEAKTVYFLKDHLGSIRATVLDSATAPVMAYDDYDPWGYILPMRSKVYGDLSGSQAGAVGKNKFTGKEWDDEHSLNWNYFGARYYDPAIGRFLSVDRFADKYPSHTPYHYTLNNPVRFIDINGDSTFVTVNEDKTLSP